MESDGKGPHADEAAPDYHSTTTVTEVITTVVKPGQEEAFRRWAERIQQGQARFPGYMGTLVQAPLSPEVPYWTTLVRFESPAFLDAWLQSPERQAILDRSDAPGIDLAEPQDEQPVRRVVRQ